MEGFSVSELVALVSGKEKAKECRDFNVFESVQLQAPFVRTLTPRGERPDVTVK